MNKTIQIHIITNFAEVGGAEEMLIRYVNSVKSTRCIIVSLMGTSKLMSGKLQGNVEILNLNCKSALDLLLAPFKLKKIIKTLKPNTIFSWMYHANFVAALTKYIFPNIPPVIWGVRHSLDDLAGEGISTKLAIYAGRLLKNIPSKTIYCADRAMQQHINFGYSPKGKSVYIPNGYDFEENQSRTIEKGSLVIGAAGRFHEAKDYGTLFKALAPILSANSNIKLRIAGRDINNSNEILRLYIKEQGINPNQVQLLGQLNNMPEFYRSLDFFVLSSKTEGFPNVLAEAAGYGCITFSTDVGDAGIILNDNSRLVPIGDSKALENLLIDYINMPSDKLMKISKQAACFIRSTYSIDVISKKILLIGSEQ